MSSLSLPNFLKYIKAFNAKDYTTQHTFYHPSVTLTLPDPQIGTLHGSSGISTHYASVHAHARETVVPMIVMIDSKLNRIFFSMEAYFYYFHPTDNAVHGHKVSAGDVIRVKVWALYDIVDGKMGGIVCNALGDEFLGQVDVDECIRESWGRADGDVKAAWGPRASL